MKLKTILLTLTFIAVVALSTHGADVFLVLKSAPGAGNKIRMEGDSSIHKWQCESTTIGGYAEVGAGFPLKPGAEVKPGKIDAKVSIFIPVSRLKSVKPDGTPDSSDMDDKVYKNLLEPKFDRITYNLTELTLKEAPKAADAAYQFDSKGELCVAGVTNKITMPVMVTVLAENKVKFAGGTTVKMSDFKIVPPALTVMGIGITTSDDVKLFFEWTAYKKSTNPPAGTAK